MNKKTEDYASVTTIAPNVLDFYMDIENRALIRKEPYKYAVEQGLILNTAEADAIEVKVVTCKADTLYIPLWDASSSHQLVNLENIQAAGAEVSTLSSIMSLSTWMCVLGTVSTFSSVASASSVMPE